MHIAEMSKAPRSAWLTPLAASASSRYTPGMPACHLAKLTGLEQPASTEHEWTNGRHQRAPNPTSRRIVQSMEQVRKAASGSWWPLKFAGVGDLSPQTPHVHDPKL